MNLTLSQIQTKTIIELLKMKKAKIIKIKIIQFYRDIIHYISCHHQDWYAVSLPYADRLLKIK